MFEIVVVAPHSHMTPRITNERHALTIATPDNKSPFFLILIKIVMREYIPKALYTIEDIVVNRGNNYDMR